MLIRKLLCVASLIMPVLAAGAAQAQSAPELPAESIDDGSDTFTLAAGGIYMPTYEGSDDYRISPAGIARGRVSGFNFWTRGTNLFIDLIPWNDSGLDFSAGPVGGVRFNRTGNTRDTQVNALGELNTAYEIGGFVGIAKTGVITSAYDNIGVRVSYQKDIGNAHKSSVIIPSIEYGTPLSTQTFVGIGASLEFVGDGYASYYFDVSPAGSIASGLPTFSANGGFKSWGVNMLLVQALTGDLRGGLQAAVIGSYNRLQGDFRRSPITSVAGSPNQWMGGIGLAYTW